MCIPTVHFLLVDFLLKYTNLKITFKILIKIDVCI